MVSGRFAVSMERSLGSGMMPTRIKVKPVGVPAGVEHDVGVRPLMCVPGTSSMQQTEIGIRKIEQEPPEFKCVRGDSRDHASDRNLRSIRGESWRTAKSCTTSTLAPVSVTYLGTILQNPRPMGDAVIAIPGILSSGFALLKRGD